MKPTFYIDLDRTLFHTDRIAELFPVLERLYPENTALRNGFASREQYFVFPHVKDGDTKTYYYDLARQLREAGLDLDKTFDALRTELGDGRFEYEGARELMRALRTYGSVKILTYGEDVYQKFKASLCPSLRGLEVITTVKPKVEYLNDCCVAGDWIVDDKIIDGLALGIRAVHIQHDRMKLADVHSLHEAGSFIMQGLASDS